MLKIYGNAVSCPSNKVIMCANAIGLNYDYLEVDLLKGAGQSPEHLALHPAGKVPVIDDDGVVIFESDAIMKYLCVKHSSKFYPGGLIAQAKVDQWCNFISIHLANGYNRVFFNKVVAPKIKVDVDEPSIECGYKFLERFIPIIENQLNKSQNLASDELTIADFCLLAIIDPSEIIEFDLTRFPKLTAWREGLRSQTFYQKVHKYYCEGF